MATMVRCKYCRTIYNLSQRENCPGCNGYAGSMLNAVDLLEPDDPDYPTVETGSFHIETVDSSTGASDIDRELVVKEYFQCLSIIDSFDQRALTIKAWSVTASLAGIGSAFTYNKPDLFLVSALSSLIFWWLEARWKTFQSMYMSRAKDIEHYLQGKSPDTFYAPALREHALRFWAKGAYARFWSLMFHTHVYLPHALITILGVILWISRKG